MAGRELNWMEAIESWIRSELSSLNDYRRLITKGVPKHPKTGLPWIPSDLPLDAIERLPMKPIIAMHIRAERSSNNSPWARAALRRKLSKLE